MKTCETCKHWSPPDPRDAHEVVGTCMRVLPGSDYKGLAGISLAGAGSIDTTATLATWPTFGCVLHEARVCEMCRGSGVVQDWQGFTKVHDHKPCPKCAGGKP